MSESKPSPSKPSPSKPSPGEMVKIGFAVAQAYQAKALETLSADDLANAKRHRLFAETILDLMNEYIEMETVTNDLFPATHRLALELECLLMDTKDSAVVSKWWDSAHEALEEFRGLTNKSHGQPEKQPETNVPAIVFFPAGSLGEEVDLNA